MRAHVVTSRIMGFIVTSVPVALKMDALTHPEVKCSVKLSFKPQENAVPPR